MNSYEALVTSMVAELSGALQSVDANELMVLERALLQAPRIFVAGMGRSGLCMRAFAMRIMHLGLPAYVVGDVTTPGIDESDLLLIGSGSGRTASLVQYAARAQALQAQVGLITTARTSPLGDYSNYVVRVNAPTPKRADSIDSVSVQPMGSLFEQSLGLLLDIVVMRLMQALDISAEQMFARHANLE